MVSIACLPCADQTSCSCEDENLSHGEAQVPREQTWMLMTGSKKNGKQETKTCWRTCLPKRTLTRIGLGGCESVHLIRCISTTSGHSMSYHSRFSTCAFPSTIFSPVNQSHNLAGGMAEPVDHHSQEETGDPAVCGRGLVFRRRFGRAWLVQVISSALCEGVSIYGIYCRYAKQKNGCPFLSARIHPHLPITSAQGSDWWRKETVHSFGWSLLPVASLNMFIPHISERVI